MISTVLIVEDETILAIALRSMLQSFGFQVVATARTCTEAISQTQACHPDLIVMDINLADDATGLDAAEEIRHFSNIPIVFQSATQEEEILQRVHTVTHSTFLPKTLSKIDWIDAISPFAYDHRPAA